jgi:glycosyltransferase involved in cell wall biosynthesis
MLKQNLQELAPSAARAIIINCSTKLVSTLALLSAIKQTGMPVLLIDCESTDDSLKWFQQLMGQYSFDLLSLPLRPHGITLDRLFNETKDEALLLIDSDLEIINPAVISDVRQAMVAPSVYGAGFLHRGGDMALQGHTKVNSGRYMDRMWIPFSFLKVASVRAALARAATFMHSRDYLEFPWNKSISKLLYARHRVPLVKNISLDAFTEARERIHGERFAFREYDTGARVHDDLIKNGLHFADLGEPHFSSSVKHYHGVTRATLANGQANATAPNLIANEVRARLASVYDITGL